MHSATKPATLGLVLMLTGAMLVLPIPGAVAKLLLVILLQFVTARSQRTWLAGQLYVPVARWISTPSWLRMPKRS